VWNKQFSGSIDQVSVKNRDGGYWLFVVDVAPYL
jgi:hypothetical protein